MARPAYPIRTERLALRPFEAADLAAVFDMERREDVVRYLYWGTRDRDEVRQALAERVTMTSIESQGDAIRLAITLHEGGSLIGDVSLRYVSADDAQGEVGFVVHPDHHGRGYATEAAREMLRLGFEEVGMHRIVGRCEARNTPSARVLERLGMRREAHLIENEWVKGEWNDELIYAMLDREWAARS
jgi:RimJ/RimL family protein N-acetyltransferase